MFIGHYAVGLAGRAAPFRPGLGVWFLAVQLPDLIWPALVLLGVERVRIEPGNTPVTPLAFDHYPYTHSLLGTLVLAVALGALYRWRTGERAGAAWLGGAVLSHWLLDALSHRPDLLLWPGGAVKVGLGLWHSPLATVLVEGALFAVGAALYLRATRPLDRTGRWAPWALLGLLAAIYAANLLGPPPPNVTAMAVTGLVGLWAFVPFAAWVDRHRAPRAARD